MGAVHLAKMMMSDGVAAPTRQAVVPRKDTWDGFKSLHFEEQSRDSKDLKKIASYFSDCFLRVLLFGRLSEASLALGVLKVKSGLPSQAQA